MSTISGSGPATEYARQVDSSDFSWSGLEAAAFGAHEPVAQALARAAGERGAPPTRVAEWGGMLAGLLAFVVMLAPVLAPGIIIAFGRGAEARVGAVVVAGVLAAAHVVLRVRDWLRLGRGLPVGTPRELLLAAISVPFGVLSAVLAGLVAAADASPAAWASFAALVAMTASCVASVAVLRSAARRGRMRPPTADMDAQAAVAALEPHERDIVTADLVSSLAVLVERGVISEAERDGALRAPLGALARRRWAGEGASHRA